MKNQTKKSVKKEVLSQTALRTEGGKISPEDIMFSFAPLIEEYFCGKAVCRGGKIIYFAPGGQNFRIAASEVK